MGIEYNYRTKTYAQAKSFATKFKKAKGYSPEIRKEKILNGKKYNYTVVSPSGWTGESTRHAMARYGIKTGRKPVLKVDSKGKFTWTKEAKRLPTIVGVEAKKKNPITPMPKGFNVWDVEDPEGAGMTPEDEIKMWQHLEDTGMAYSLQGWYGRTAMALIASGKIKPNPKYHSKEQLDAYKEQATIQKMFDLP